MRDFILAGLRILGIGFVWATCLLLLIEFLNACARAKVELQVP